jgi:hypothetical protein
MERARRQAASPMRIILEAAKAKRRPGEDAAPAAPEPASVRPVATRSATSTTAANAAPANTTPATAALAGAAAPTAAAAFTSPNPSPAPEPRVVTPAPTPEPAQATLSSPALQNKSVAPVAGLGGTGGANSSVIAPVPEPPPVLARATGRPKLLKMVEPDVPQRVLDELGPNATVSVDLTIRADGSVGKVALASPAPRQMGRLLATAMGQWQFDAAAIERSHRIELVFNADR